MRLQPRGYKVVPGVHYGTPKEVWGFRSAPTRGGVVSVARRFLRANADLLGLRGILARLGLAKVIESAGAYHVIFQQRHRRLRIHRAYVTVHIGRGRRVYLAKNRAVPQDLLPTGERFRLRPGGARRRALGSVPRRGPRRVSSTVERLWFPVKNRIHPAFRFRVHTAAPRAEWIVYVDAATGGVLSRYDNLAEATGRARVFDPNPVIALGDWRPLVGRKRVRRPPPELYTSVRLLSLARTGFLDGPRVSTSATAHRVQRPDGRFEFSSTEAGFGEVMVYFHVDRAIRYLESLGYRGRRAIFRAPLPADAHGTRDDNSWYSPELRRLTFGTGGVDDAEDAEIVLHEFGHAVQDAICPDFGQSPEAAAMGEGFGDYWAASFFAARKPPRFRTSVASWDAIASDEFDPPCLRRVDDARTYESFDHSSRADEHENGKIWSATLWKIRQRLGRAAADRIIVESHFQLDGFTSFAKGARAILDADRNLHGGRHGAALRHVLREQGIGPVE